MYLYARVLPLLAHFMLYETMGTHHRTLANQPREHRVMTSLAGVLLSQAFRRQTLTLSRNLFKIYQPYAATR